MSGGMTSAASIAGMGAGGLTAGSLISYGSLAGSVLQAGGSMQQAGQQKALGKLQQAGAGLAGAEGLRQNSQEALDAIHRRRLVEGQAIAQIGANGLTTSGSAADVLNDIGNSGATEVQRILQTGSRTYQGALMSGEGMRISADMQAKQTQMSGFSNLLTGTANTMYLRKLTTPRPFLKPNLGAPAKNPLFDGY